MPSEAVAVVVSGLEVCMWLFASAQYDLCYADKPYRCVISRLSSTLRVGQGAWCEFGGPPPVLWRVETLEIGLMWWDLYAWSLSRICLLEALR